MSWSKRRNAHFNSEQLPKKLVRAMDKEQFLVTKTVEVLQLWDFHNRLFRGKKSDYELLMGISGQFFGIVQTALQHDIILRISKLFDENSSAVSFFKLANTPDPKNLETHDRLKTFQSNHRKLLNFRHNTIAHSNAKISLRKKTQPMPTTSDIEKCLLDLISIVDNLFSTDIQPLRQDKSLAKHADTFLEYIRQHSIDTNKDSFASCSQNN